MPRTPWGCGRAVPRRGRAAREAIDRAGAATGTRRRRDLTAARTAGAPAPPVGGSGPGPVPERPGGPPGTSTSACSDPSLHLVRFGTECLAAAPRPLRPFLDPVDGDGAARDDCHH